jgi:hypothetical protein
MTMAWGPRHAVDADFAGQVYKDACITVGYPLRFDSSGGV